MEWEWVGGCLGFGSDCMDRDMPTYCLNAAGLCEDPVRVRGRSGWLVERLMK
jgi:hypothetical protein